MELKEASRIYNRMCEYYSCNCKSCPLSSDNNSMNSVCDSLFSKHPDKAEEILIKWSKQHPQKTRLEDFKKKHPNAPMNYDNIPLVCSRDVGYLLECPINKGYSKFTCTDCWNQPIDD